MDSSDLFETPGNNLDLETSLFDFNVAYEGAIRSEIPAKGEPKLIGSPVLMPFCCVACICVIMP